MLRRVIILISTCESVPFSRPIFTSATPRITEVAKGASQFITPSFSLSPLELSFKFLGLRETAPVLGRGISRGGPLVGTIAYVDALLVFVCPVVRVHT